MGQTHFTVQAVLDSGISAVRDAPAELRKLAGQEVTVTTEDSRKIGRGYSVKIVGSDGTTSRCGLRPLQFKASDFESFHRSLSEMHRDGSVKSPPAQRPPRRTAADVIGAIANPQVPAMVGSRRIS